MTKNYFSLLQEPFFPLKNLFLAEKKKEKFVAERKSFGKKNIALSYTEGGKFSWHKNSFLWEVQILLPRLFDCQITTRTAGGVIF